MGDPAFEVRVLTVAPGAVEAYQEAEWRDALVVVESGEIELEGLGGTRRTFGRGAILSLAGLPLSGLRNRGREPVLLVAVAREAND
jgi:hypothetical protein